MRTILSQLLLPLLLASPEIAFAGKSNPVPCPGTHTVKVSGRVDVFGGWHTSVGRLLLMCEGAEDQRLHSLHMISSSDGGAEKTTVITLSRFLRATKEWPAELVTAKLGPIGPTLITIRPDGDFSAAAGGNVVIEFLGESPGAPDLFLSANLTTEGWRVERRGGGRLLEVKDLVGNGNEIHSYTVVEE